MQKPIVVTLVFSAIGLAAAPGPVSATPASFDGTWTVRLVTESGTCESSYSQTVAVENRQVRAAGVADGPATSPDAVRGDGRDGVGGMARWP